MDAANNSLLGTKSLKFALNEYDTFLTIGKLRIRR